MQRIGLGHDSHRLGPGDTLILGGGGSSTWIA